MNLLCLFESIFYLFNQLTIFLPYVQTKAFYFEFYTEIRVMTNLVFGIGIGLFVILTLWLSAALIFTVSLRIDKRIGAIAIAVTAIITIILISVPRSSDNPASHQEKPYDQLFIWRVILLTVLAGSSLIAIFGYVKYELMECKKPQRITNWIY
ncbi:hypothetical protein PV328_009338 [Microctonus aethiopoides]|uniref:Uncharacterized protein n=1 Tax=Microctonus aethiopoides TaxID=144406 RepID=A0AA39C5J6_9HYME|nr:hypothetical protein PV328_009338 [Microctonus aethiopoides]